MTTAGADSQSAVQGHVEPGFEPVAKLFANLFTAPTRGGGAFVVRRGDRVLIDVWGGLADPHSGRLWERSTMGLSFSTSKGVAAAVIHRLADQGRVGYDEPVAAFWPQFAAGGKGRITVRQLLSHQAGLDRLAPIAPNAAALLDHLGAEDRLAACTPDHAAGTPAYHAITYGWLMAGLARAVTGQGMEKLVHTEINEPLGVDGLHFGAVDGESERVSAGTGSLGRLVTLAPVSALLPGFMPPRRGLESVWVPDLPGLFAGPKPRVLQTVMPAVNGVFTAESLATLYGALAQDGTINGRQLLSSETVRLLRRVQTRGRDRNLGLPALWRMGYHQAVMARSWPRRAFGQYGYAGSGGWADPDSGLSAAFVSNRVFPVSSPFGDFALFRLSGLALACARNALRH
jgi:CubicO group peptidase (beta-lactamase class C family)